jgi:hypothetical protein
LLWWVMHCCDAIYYVCRMASWQLPPAFLSCCPLARNYKCAWLQMCEALNSLRQSLCSKSCYCYDSCCVQVCIQHHLQHSEQELPERLPLPLVHLSVAAA